MRNWLLFSMPLGLLVAVIVAQQVASRSYPLSDTTAQYGALFFAVKNDDISAVRRILDHNPDDLNAASHSGASLAVCAIMWRSDRVLNELLRRKVRLSGYEGKPLLIVALQWGSDCSIRLLIDAGEDPNCRDSELGLPALHWAVLHDRVDAIKVLANAGANLDAVDFEMNQSALLLSVVHAKSAAEQALRDLGARTDIVDRSGRSVYMRGDQ